MIRGVVLIESRNGRITESTFKRTTEVMNPDVLTYSKVIKVIKPYLSDDCDGDSNNQLANKQM